jgi:diacylglycerol kinase family enzyme
MHMAPMALLDDGFLDILYVKNANLFKFIVHVLAKVYEAKHLDYDRVFHHRAKKLNIECPRTCLIDIDGEEEKALRVSVSIIPKAIRVFVP